MSTQSDLVLSAIRRLSDLKGFTPDNSGESNLIKKIIYLINEFPKYTEPRDLAGIVMCGAEKFWMYNCIFSERVEETIADAKEKRADAEVKLDDAKEKLDDAEGELDDAKEELADAEEKLDDAEKELAYAKEKLADAKEKYFNSSIEAMKAERVFTDNSNYLMLLTTLDKIANNMKKSSKK